MVTSTRRHTFFITKCCSCCISHIFPLVPQQTLRQRDRKRKQNKLRLSPPSLLAAAPISELHLDGWAVIGSGSSTSSHSALSSCQETKVFFFSFKKGSSNHHSGFVVFIQSILFFFFYGKCLMWALFFLLVVS